ncbi:hypothetical protein BCR41DRAFT_93444 [Lobosporangium transversale]|uniref:Uncharacterized protein n=1 Tax=Lobosporangium transversale TaxID=64571 RepID=A0A1Y2GK38_9FUNG|nr:hypothetical protein BCR41DRAFT_93444 [Lobosporangium transversale]ORZ13346.1 hypothetical protein BCR41DRAFT_93444 [Lobosporangium transversale]|eukprot:XP_021880427.1 hypothetical protein BCR41DRAFT_93444 [Lobosporangium transversale]
MGRMIKICRQRSVHASFRGQSPTSRYQLEEGLTMSSSSHLVSEQQVRPQNSHSQSRPILDDDTDDEELAHRSIHPRVEDERSFYRKVEASAQIGRDWVAQWLKGYGKTKLPKKKKSLDNVHGLLNFHPIYNGNLILFPDEGIHLFHFKAHATSQIVFSPCQTSD